MRSPIQPYTRRAALALGVLACALLAGCEDPPAPAPSPTASPSRAPSPPEDPVTPDSSPEASPQPGPAGPAREGELVLSSSVEPEGEGHWIARWSVRNPGSSSLYLVAQLPVVKGGRPAPDPHAVYLRPEGQTLHLTKRLWRIPRGVSPLITELPYLVRLEPGQSHQGALRLPPAVASKFPYRVNPRGDEAPVSALVISMGYFREDAGVEASPDHPGLYLAPYKALESQAFVTSEAHPVELRVR